MELLESQVLNAESEIAKLVDKNKAVLFFTGQQVRQLLLDTLEELRSCAVQFFIAAISARRLLRGQQRP